MKTMKNMPMGLIGALALVLMVAFNSCKEDEGVITPVFPELKETSGQPGDTLEIAFSANLDWSIQSNAAWCKFVNGEFAEATSSGKAGEQSLKVAISDADWNYQTNDEAELKLTMMNMSQVIYKITRAKKEYQDLTITDEAGNVYNAQNRLTIKGSGLRDVMSDSVYTVVKASADMQVGIMSCPDWLYVQNMGDGVFRFIFDKGKQSVHGKDPIFSFEGEENDKIVFATKDYIEGNVETDKIRMVEVPVDYEGLKSDYVELSQDYPIPLLISIWGDQITKDDESNELVVDYTNGGKFGATVSNVRNNKFRVLVFDKSEVDLGAGVTKPVYDFTKEMDWLQVSITGDSFIVETPSPLRGVEARGAIILVFSEDFCKQAEGDWAAALLDDEGYIKEEYTKNIFATLTQKDTSLGIKGYVMNEAGEMLPFGQDYEYDYGEEPDQFLLALSEAEILDWGGGNKMITANKLLCKNNNKIYIEIVNYKVEPQVSYEPETFNNFTIEKVDLNDKKYIVLSGELTDEENMAGINLYIVSGENVISSMIQFY